MARVIDSATFVACSSIATISATIDNLGTCESLALLLSGIGAFSLAVFRCWVMWVHIQEHQKRIDHEDDRFNSDFDD